MSVTKYKQFLKKRNPELSEIFRKPQNAPTLNVIRPDHPLYVRPAKGQLWPSSYKRLKFVLQTADVVFLRGAVKCRVSSFVFCIVLKVADYPQMQSRLAHYQISGEYTV